MPNLAHWLMHHQLKYSLYSNKEIGIPMYTYTYLQGDPNWTIVFLNQLMTLALAMKIWYLIHIWKILCKTVQKPLFDLNHPVYLGTVHTYCIMHVINHIVSCPIIISVFAQNIVHTVSVKNCSCLVDISLKFAQN